MDRDGKPQLDSLMTYFVESTPEDAGGGVEQRTPAAAADQQKDEDVLLPEKIQDEEEILPLYLRVFYFVFPCLRHGSLPNNTYTFKILL